jgi:plasmid stabilization system protein ParE
LIINFSNSAIADLEAIKEYYTEQEIPQVGTKFIAEILMHVDSLSTHPDIGRIVPEFNDTSIRELIHIPFRIVYLRQPTTINIIRIWRSERLLKLD